jgi:3'(2'), 5'-bisphosphate nucleotidase
MDELVKATDFHNVVEIARSAGAAILEIYNRSEGLEIERKADNSPLTLADRQSHAVISKGLKLLCPEIPVLSEEGKAIPYAVRSTWERYWLVDPLDGTKEFINRNGEFTVNIALMERKHPIAGVVYAPAVDLLYYSWQNNGAFKQDSHGGALPIAVDKNPVGGLVAAQSRSHASPEEIEFLKQFDIVRTIQIGSSLKFCMVAEGKAHIYPRFGRMMEWDTAAGHAVVEEAGGSVRSWNGDPSRYNTESLRHEGMVVSSIRPGEK